jgi:hypothetical protein
VGFANDRGRAAISVIEAPFRPRHSAAQAGEDQTGSFRPDDFDCDGEDEPLLPPAGSTNCRPTNVARGNVQEHTTDTAIATGGGVRIECGCGSAQDGAESKDAGPGHAEEEDLAWSRSERRSYRKLVAPNRSFPRGGGKVAIVGTDQFPRRLLPVSLS